MTRVTREQGAEMFHRGAQRKRQEANMFAVMSVSEPEKAELFTKLADYAAVDARYYDMASWYYSDEIDNLDDGTNEDLLMLTSVSELSPKLYAEYLRNIDVSCRAEEKITHEMLQDLKSSIRAQIKRNLNRLY
jgi:hypothetical protein